MPSPDQILAGLTALARDHRAVAAAWHVALAIALVALALGWRPGGRLARALIAAPLASVAAFAVASGNPFNGGMFAAGAVALVALAVTGDDRAVARGSSGGTWWIGALMIGFGWLYPHFLAGSPVAYLYAAPLGLVPCPTLAVAIGLALLGGAGGRLAWSLTLAGLGLFYGLFGALRLGVYLDVALVAGATALALAAVGRRVGRAPAQRASRASRAAASAPRA